MTPPPPVTRLVAVRARGLHRLLVAAALLAATGPGCVQILGDDYEILEPEPEPPAPPPVCEEEPTCEECVSCRLSGECASDAAVCFDSQTPCGAYIDCNSKPGCEDSACDDQCTSAYPEGSQYLLEVVHPCTYGFCGTLCP